MCNRREEKRAPRPAKRRACQWRPVHQFRPIRFEHVALTVAISRNRFGLIAADLSVSPVPVVRLFVASSAPNKCKSVRSTIEARDSGNLWLGAMNLRQFHPLSRHFNEWLFIILGIDELVVPVADCRTQRQKAVFAANQKINGMFADAPATRLLQARTGSLDTSPTKWILYQRSSPPI